MKINFSLYVKMKKVRSQWSIGVLGYWSIAKTKRHYSITPLLLFIFFLLFTAQGLATEISVVNVKTNNNDIYVTTSLKPDSKFMNDINDGISKELIFYIDLFRVWSVWPDEFVIGRKLVKVLKSNPIKREYVASSIDGNVQLEKRFKDLESMMDWTMNITDTKLTNIKELEPGEYFVKVTVDSRIRKLPPVIGYLLFFVPEKEFSITRDSQIFKINPKNSP
jgi:hypothetical protein